MAASGNGDDITAGETNHSDSGTELICSPKDGHPGNDYILHVKPGLLLDSVDGIRGEGFGRGNGVVGTGHVGVSGVGQLVGVAGRVNEKPPKLPQPLDQAGVLGSSFGNRLSAGVVGESEVGYGVFGTTDSGIGVRGESKRVGVQGAGDTGVQGLGAARGVHGTADEGIGILGTSVTGVGVSGTSNGPGGTGVLGTSVTGVGVVAEANNSNLEALFAHNNGGGLAAFFLGGVRVQGDFTVFAGLKSAAVPHPDGSHRLLYCLESPESWFEDFGEDQLVDGKAEVRLDPDFGALVEVDGYHVFVTPYGESKGLFVAERYATGFRVCEQQGGTSNVNFAYRVVAKRKDVVADRLARVTPREVPSKAAGGIGG
jgi:hypothetical protein